MSEPFVDPAHCAGDKLRVEVDEAPPIARAELKARIARTVREDSKERRAPTQEHVIQDLAPDLPREELSAVLGEMAVDEEYADIKAIVAPSSRIYLFSEALLPRDEAGARCLAEEAKHAIVRRIRKDSQHIVLTPASHLDELFPWPDPEKRAALMAELQADERFKDIQAVVGAGGELYYHSDAHVSGNYGKIMMRARTSDAGLAIAELVRDRSRTMPAPTSTALFQDRVFGLSAAQVKAFVDALAKPAPEYADIKTIVHPTTAAVYLYSDKWMDDLTAYRIMDWQEVGAAQNP
jgi:hypothetical protein